MLTVSKIIIGGLFFAAVSLGLAGCNLPLTSQDSTPNSTEVYQTADAIMTEKVEPSSSSEISLATTPAPQVITPTLNQIELIVVTIDLQSPSATPLCDRVKPGIPLDVTVPDDTRLEPGESFTKIWRFANDGACTWTRDYAVVWFSGDELGAEKVQSFGDPIEPGETTDVNVDMVAPKEPGVYESYWMMRDGQGRLFGLGPNGNAPFWVRIQVVAVNTATPTPTIEPTSTPVVQLSGEASLDQGQSFDLDSGKLSQAEADDVELTKKDDSGRKLIPINNARLGVFGQLQPAEFDCRGAVLSNDPVDLSKVDVGDYLCYRTNQGLPGSLHMIQLPGNDAALQFEYITWVAP